MRSWMVGSGLFLLCQLPFSRKTLLVAGLFSRGAACNTDCYGVLEWGGVGGGVTSRVRVCFV